MPMQFHRPRISRVRPLPLLGVEEPRASQPQRTADELKTLVSQRGRREELELDLEACNSGDTLQKLKLVLLGHLRRNAPTVIQSRLGFSDNLAYIAEYFQEILCGQLLGVTCGRKIGLATGWPPTGSTVESPDCPLSLPCGQESRSLCSCRQSSPRIDFTSASPEILSRSLVSGIVSSSIGEHPCGSSDR